MADWSNNDRDNLEALTVAVGEVLRESPEDAVYGLVNAACGVFCVPSFVLGHARRGLRDFRDELKRWKDPIDAE